MNDPKRQPWLYLISGLVAIGAATFFLSVDGNVFDWAILGLGAYAVWKGIQLFREQAQAGQSSSEPDTAAPDAADASTDSDEQSEPKES